MGYPAVLAVVLFFASTPMFYGSMEESAVRWFPMTEAEALDILQQSKFGDPAMHWTQKPSHGGALVLAFGLTDGTGIAIPGLTVALEWQPPKRLRPPTLLLSLNLRQNGITDRAYQLEICAPEHPSHMERGIMKYGPHEHVGDTVTMLPNLAGYSFGQALNLYLQRTNITLTEVPPAPDAFDLT